VTDLDGTGFKVDLLTVAAVQRWATFLGEDLLDLVLALGLLL
jgi:hypothetical protein